MKFKSFAEIRKEMKRDGIKVVRQNVRYGVGYAYRVVGARGINPYAIWDANEIKTHYYHVGFVKDE